MPKGPLVALLALVFCGCQHPRVTDPELCVESERMPQAMGRRMPEHQTAQAPATRPVSSATTSP